MRWKSLIVLGILLYVLIFVEISVIMFIPALATQKITQKTIHFALLAVFTLICGSIYFKKEKRGSIKDGLIFGLAVLIIGTILDLLITVPLFVKSFSAFYKDWTLWLGFLEVLVFSAASAKAFSRK